MSWNLFDLEDVKAHLHITDTASDVDLLIKIRLAEDIVMDHVKLTAIPDAWYVEASPDLSPPIVEVPGNIEAAFYLILGELNRNREASVADIKSAAVIALLSTKRDPTMA